MTVRLPSYLVGLLVELLGAITQLRLKLLQFS